VPSLLLVIGDAAPNVNEVADPLLFVGSVVVVVGLLIFNLDESKENAGDDCLDESNENTAGCLSFDLLLETAAVLLVTLLLSFDDDIVVCGILYLCKEKGIDTVNLANTTKKVHLVRYNIKSTHKTISHFHAIAAASAETKHTK